MDVLALSYDVREQDIVGAQLVPNYVIDVVVEGVLDAPTRCEIIRGLLPPAIGITAEIGSSTVPGYALSSASTDAAGVEPLQVPTDRGCMVINGELRANHATGAQIAQALSMHGAAPVIWKGCDKGDFTLTCDVNGNQDAVIERIAASCHLKIDRSDVSIRTLTVKKRLEGGIP